MPNRASSSARIGKSTTPGRLGANRSTPSRSTKPGTPIADSLQLGGARHLGHDGRDGFEDGRLPHRGRHPALVDDPAGLQGDGEAFRAPDVDADRAHGQ